MYFRCTKISIDKLSKQDKHICFVSFKPPSLMPLRWIKGIRWEIYEFVSEVFSHLGRKFCVIFSLFEVIEIP